MLGRGKKGSARGMSGRAGKERREASALSLFPSFTARPLTRNIIQLFPMGILCGESDDGISTARPVLVLHYAGLRAFKKKNIAMIYRDVK